MKMNTKPIVNLAINLDELIDAFKQLPASPGEQPRHAVKFSVKDDYGKDVERQLLFTWNQEENCWELDSKGHDLVIRAPR